MIFFSVFLFFNFISLFTLGCHGLPQSSSSPSCHEPDWFERGRLAGIQGLFEEKKSTQPLCTNTPQEKTKELFESGYQKGLQQYCQPHHFFILGKLNTKHQAHLCPSDSQSELKKNYSKGQKLIQKTL